MEGFGEGEVVSGIIDGVIGMMLCSIYVCSFVCLYFGSLCEMIMDSSGLD